MSSERSALLADVLSSEPPDRLLELATLLREHQVVLGSRRARLERRLRGSQESIGRIAALLTHWDGEDEAWSAEVLADVLEAAAGTALKDNADEDAELVWTGPNVGHPTARRTQPVLNELLEWASRRVTIVGYSLFLGGALTADLMERLGELSTRGVTIEFIVDRRYSGWSGESGEGHSVREIQKYWPKGRRRPRIYSWASPDGDSAKLHAKVVIVDGRDLLVTSANLSGAGLADNLELGVRIRGDVAADCADHFEGLVRSGFFALETWDDGA